MMKHYDYTYLTRQDISEEDAKKVQDDLAAFLQEKNSVIVDLPKAYKKRLAYRIKKQDAAYVNSILFQSQAETAIAFKKEADINPAILRGLLVAYDPEKLKIEMRRERPARIATDKEASAPVPTFEPKKEAAPEKAPEKKEVKDEAEIKEKAKEVKEEKKEPASAKGSGEATTAPEKAPEAPKKESKEKEKEAKEEKKKEEKEEKPAAKPRRKKIKVELRDIEEKLDEILK